MSTASAKRDWPSLLMLSLPLIVVAWTTDGARWVSAVSPLWAHVIPALGLGYFIATRVRPPLMAHLIGAFVAIGVAAAVGFAALGGTSVMGMGVLLVWSTWSLAYTTSWLAYRTKRSRWSFVPGLLVMFLVLANLPQSTGSQAVLYLALSGPAIAMFHHRLRHDAAAPSGTDLPFAGLMMAGAVAMAASMLPTLDGAPHPAFVARAADAWQQLASRSSFFDEVPNRREISRLSIEDKLPLTAPFELSGKVMLIVQSKEPRKWRMETYESYSIDGWANPASENRSFPAEGLRGPGRVPPLLARREVRISVQTAAIMKQIATPGIPISSTIENRQRHPTAPRFRVDIAGPQRTYLPPDIEAIRDQLADGRTPEQANAIVIESELVVDQFDDAAMVLRRPSNERSEPHSLVFANGRIPPRVYDSVGSVSDATFGQLRAATGEYSNTISDRYLQLPLEFPDRVRVLTLEIVRGHDNAYDQAVAIQRYLRALPYSTDITGPPEGRDPVEWFLFESRTGFCNYYASAMITMLRSLGVPARLAIGFAPGTFSDSEGGWIVEARQYHSWPEVYFPDYGWVEFEPTSPGVQSSLRLIDRPLSEPMRLTASVATQPLSCLGDELLCEEINPEEESLDDPVDSFPRSTESRWGTLFTIALVSLAMIAVTLALAVMARAYRGEPTRRAYLYVRTVARINGLHHVPHETPVELADRVSERLPQSALALATIVESYDIVHYSEGRRLTTQERYRLRTASRSTRREMFSSVARNLAASPILRQLVRTLTRRSRSQAMPTS